MTELNNESMKTVVETFLVEEVTELIYDNEQLDKWNSLVGELGLEGQTKVVKPEKSPIPFLYLNNGMKNVFTTLCPSKVHITQFDKTPIPVEILDLVALSNKENYFQRIEIWYDDKNPDPACVGIKEDWAINGNNLPDGLPRFDNQNDCDKYIKENDIDGESYHYSWQDNHYLLGKWADMKHSLDELKEMARKRYITEKENNIKKKIRDYNRKLEDIETAAIDYINGSNDPISLW